MDRFKRQELINKACASFSDPLLPEHVRAKAGTVEYVNGKKVHPWRHHLPLFRETPIQTPVFDEWRSAKISWEKQKPHERQPFFPDLKLIKVKKVKGDAAATKTIDPDNSNGAGGGHGSNVIQPSSSSSSSTPTKDGKGKGKGKGPPRLTHGNLKAHSAHSRKAWLQAEGDRLGLRGFKFQWPQPGSVAKAAAKPKPAKPTTSTSNSNASLPTKASITTASPATGNSAMAAMTSTEAKVVMAKAATASATLSSTTPTATRTTATMTTKRKLGGVGNMTSLKFLERCAAVGIDQAGKEAKVKSWRSTGEFESKYILVMPPEFHQWNAQRKAYQNISPAEKRRRLRANKDGYEDGGSWVTGESMVGDMPWEEETQPFTEGE